MVRPALHDIARSRPIGVGIVGANPDHGWAAKAHIPALQLLPEYRLGAVSTSRQASAEAAGRAFGVPAFSDLPSLLARNDIDLVVITVKVPHHGALVEAALRAGKHVLCEWPLGVDSIEARSLAALAGDHDLAGLVGLQARASPALRYIRDLVRQGYVGRVLSTTMIGSGMQWGTTFSSDNAYIADERTGATMLTIPFGHSVDALCWCLGEFRTLTATMATVRPDARNIDTGAPVLKTAADQIAVSGHLDGGAVAAIHYRGGRSRGTNFLWEINGEDGDLQIRAETGHLQMAAPTITGARRDTDWAPLPVPTEYLVALGAPPGPPENIAHAYALIALGRPAATFSDALRRHEMIDAIREAAAAAGTRRYGRS